MEYCILLSEIVKMQNFNCFIQYLQVHALVYVSLFPYISLSRDGSRDGYRTDQ